MTDRPDTTPEADEPEVVSSTFLDEMNVRELKLIEELSGTSLSGVIKAFENGEFTAGVLEGIAAILAWRDQPDLDKNAAIAAAQLIALDDIMVRLADEGDNPPE